MTDEIRAALGKMVSEAEEVGDLVLNGIRTNALYIFTAPEFRPGRDRAVRGDPGGAGPTTPERARVARELVPGLVGKPDLSPERGECEEGVGLDPFDVMVGLDPAIHVAPPYGLCPRSDRRRGMDPRVKPEDDE